MSQKFNDLINSETLVLIDFTATWCQPCKVMGSVLVSVKKEIGDEARIIKVDVDQYPDIAAQYQVRGVPTLAMFKKGEMLWRESGVKDVNTMVNLIRQYK